MRAVNQAVLAEGFAATALLAVLTWLGFNGWQTYRVYLLPAARVVPTVTPTPVVDPAAAREEGRRLRQVLDHVGAGIALRSSSPRAAVEEFMQALALDPSNFEARKNLVEMGIQPPAGPAVTPTAPRPTPPPTITPRITR